MLLDLSAVAAHIVYTFSLSAKAFSGSTATSSESDSFNSGGLSSLSSSERAVSCDTNQVQDEKIGPLSFLLIS